MRPQPIIWFERIIFGTLILGVIQSYLGWDQMIAVASKTQSNPIGFTLVVQIFTFAVIAALTLLVSRRRSRVAMWVFIVITALGIPAFIAIIAKGLLLGSGFISALQTVGELVAFALLFTPSSRHWMARKAEAD